MSHLHDTKVDVPAEENAPGGDKHVEDQRDGFWCAEESS